MYLENLTLFQYRNYECLQKNFDSQILLLIGPNAQGKTNLLEAVYYLAHGKTYRPAQDRQLIKWGSRRFDLAGTISNRHGKAKIEFCYKISEEEQSRYLKSKEIKINGLKIKKMSELLGNLTVVLFAPEDLNIVKGSPADRRRLLDSDLSQASPYYFTRLQRYQRLLAQRNALLKNMAGGAKKRKDFEIWDQQYLEISTEIITKRLHVLEKLTPLTRLIQRRLTEGQENLEIKYICNRHREVKKSDNIRMVLQQEMESCRIEEQRRGLTLWGPHRDDLSFYLNGNDLKYYGSQGQHRTAVLAIKLAVLEFLKAETGEYPVLLLDDVMSELDSKRREHLIKAIEEKAIQCFITTTEDISFLWQGKKGLQIYRIINGNLK